MNPLLTIAIPTIYSREREFVNLTSKLKGDIQRIFQNGTIKSLNEVSIIYDIDNRQTPIGEKRESLYKASKGLYTIEIDDDDELSPNAIELILNVIKSNPYVDCITFEEHIDIDGKIQRSNHSLKYDDWHDNYDGYDYVRTPFFKSVIKTEIAKLIPIPHIRFGEDHQWAQALKPHLKNEVHIDQQLYKYIHRSSDFNERYGIK